METTAQHLSGTESNPTQAESRTQQPSSNLTRSQLAFVAQTIEEDSAKCNSVSSSDCDEAFKQAITRYVNKQLKSAENSWKKLKTAENS